MPSVSAFAGAGASINDADYAWANAGNITADDGSNATVSGRRLSAAQSDSLRGTSFGFSIPVGATIDGIVFEVQWSASYNNTTSFVEANLIRLVKASSPVGNTEDFGGMPTSLTTSTIGTSSYLWGTTWSVSDINDSGFGVQVSMYLDESGNAVVPTALVDYFKLTVHYTESSKGNMFLVF